MPQLQFEEFAKYPQFKGLFVGGCVERGDGSRFRRKAHAHTSKRDALRGWICVLSPKRLDALPIRAHRSDAMCEPCARAVAR